MEQYNADTFNLRLKASLIRKENKEEVPNNIAFVIPTFNHPPDRICNSVTENFNVLRNQIIVVNDGSSIQFKVPENITEIKHKMNLGLARSLLSGYREAINLPVEYIVRVDADCEYSIFRAKQIIEILDQSSHLIGGFVEMKRSINSSGIADAIFHNVMGYFEGVTMLGKPFLQHSPGLQVYKKNTLVSIFPKLESFVAQYNPRWGLDLVVIKFASKQGELFSIRDLDHSWRERRPIGKLISQGITAISILKALQKL